MSDPNDDTLFSQDDIDKLLNASSIEEAEESIGTIGDEDIDEIAGSEDNEDIIGELSQDDIDRLLNASVFNESDGIKEDDDDDLGELSQDDIEKLINSSSDINSSSELDAPQEPISNMEDSNEGSEESSESGAFDLISQDDIDKLMATEDIDLPEPDDIEPDINLDNTVVLDENSNEELLDPSEAWSIKDCLITQDTIDDLLNKSVEDSDISDSDALDLDEQSQEDDPFKVNLSEDESEPEFNLDSTDEISNKDLDELFKDADGGMDDLLNDISQDDIDGFLKDSDELTSDASSASNGDGSDQNIVSSGDDKEAGVRNVISQDDIDALLAGTEEEDEDILADIEMDEDLKSSSVPVQNLESALPEDDNAQVILEEADDSPKTLADGTVRQLAELVDVEPKKSTKKRFLLKVITILLIFLTLMAGCVAGVYFFFFKEKVDNLLTASQKVSNLESVETDKTEIPDMAIQEDQELQPGTITLENFMVIAPNREDGITYISVDISIDYSHSTVFDEINGKLPYYRGVIYNAIDTALKSDKGDKLTESALLEIVQNALKESLPDMKITKVLFVNFKTG